MGFKNEMKQAMKNVMSDVEKEADKKWTTTYEDQTIEVHNQMKKESLSINGVLVDQKKRSSVLGHLKPFSTLRGEITTATGEKKRVTAKVGGYLKLNCIIKVDRKTIYSFAEKFEMIPWKNKEAIVPFLVQQIEEHGEIITDELPDDGYVYSEHRPRTAPGLADHSVAQIPTPFFIKKLMKCLNDQFEQGTEQTRTKTYEEIVLDEIPSYFDEFIHVFPEQNFREEDIEREALWMLEHAADREVVKFALTLLGFTNCTAHQELLKAIGKHEEFTKYAVFALQQGCTDGHEAIFDIARAVHGWGKMEAVEVLRGETEAIRSWFIKEGYQNEVLPGYNAYECMVEGRLVDQLAAAEISKELYQHAGKLISDVANYRAAGGDLEQYEETPRLLLEFMRHVPQHCESLADFYPVASIDAFLQADGETWMERNARNWTEEDQKTLRSLVKPIVEDRKWLSMAVDALEESFQVEAFEVTKYYQLNVTGSLLAHLEDNPRDEALFAAIMESDLHQDIADLCQFAVDRFNFDDLGEEEVVCISTILNEMYRFEGIGVDLIHQSLQSPIAGLQTEALLTLMNWDLATWNSNKTREILIDLKKSAPEKENRRLAKQLLKN